MVDKIKSFQRALSIYLPIVRGRKGEYKKEILNYKKRVFKIKVDGKYQINDFPNLNNKTRLLS